MPRRRPAFNPPKPPPDRVAPQDRPGSYFHNGAWFDAHDRLIGYAAHEGAPITNPGQKVPGKRIAKYNPDWNMGPVLAQHTEDTPPVYTGPIIIHDPSSEGGFRGGNSLGVKMATMRNLAGRKPPSGGPKQTNQRILKPTLASGVGGVPKQTNQRILKPTLASGTGGGGRGSSRSFDANLAPIKGQTKGGWSPTLKGSGPTKGGFKPIMGDQRAFDIKTAAQKKLARGVKPANAIGNIRRKY